VRASGIHHLGVAVVDLDEAVEVYRRLFGAELELRETIDEQGVETALLRIGDGRVELLASLAAESPVGRFLERRGPGMHHVAFEVDDVGLELERLAAEGAELIDPTPRRGLLGMEIAFVHPHATGGVLAELVAHG
jgi:methylmalonyl-CoA/ethylmalonyl-CoA epimerase